MKFLNCYIDLSQKVFRPRTETKFWVKKVVKELKKNCKAKIKVLDIFSGSGFIGVAILKNINNSKVDFVDISFNALKQIGINLKLNNISKKRYRIYHSNLFKKIKDKYDLILANPPYVALDRIFEVQKEVLKKDPLESLFGGKDGMFWIKKFLKQVKNFLKRKGIFYMEFDSCQKKEIEDILKKENFKFYFYKDQFQKVRWLKVENL